MIYAHDLSVSYESPVLEGLNIDLQPGLIHGLIGPNGSGKTTLMRVLAGQMPYEGEVSVAGADPFDNERAMDGIVFSGADLGFPVNWKATKIFKLAAMRWETFDITRAHQLLAEFDVPLDKAFGKLSLGQRSSVALVFALAARCPFTLLDEPYLGIDAGKRELLYRTLLAEQEEHPRTILLSTHHINESARVLDTVHLLADGHIYYSADAQSLVEGMSEVLGPSAIVDQLDVPRILTREVIGGTTKLLVMGEVSNPHVRVNKVDLESAVLALQEGLR